MVARLLKNFSSSCSWLSHSSPKEMVDEDDDERGLSAAVDEPDSPVMSLHPVTVGESGSLKAGSIAQDGSVHWEKS